MMAAWHGHNVYSLTDCDGRISHILGKIECQNINEVIDELATEAECDVLAELRDKVFKLCKDIFEHNLKEKGIIGETEKVDITLQRRNKKGDNGEALAEDIVKLYQYAVGLNQEFPKDVLTRSSKTKEITDKVDRAVGSESENGTADENQAANCIEAKVSLHQKLFNLEIMNLVKEQGRTIDKLSRESKQLKDTNAKLVDRLNDTTEQVARLKSIIENQTQNKHEVATWTNNETNDDPVGEGDQHTATAQTNHTTDAPPHNLHPQPLYNEVVSGQKRVNQHGQPLPELSKKETAIIAQQPRMNNPAEGSQQKHKPAVSHIPDRDGNSHTTYLHKLGTPNSLPIEDLRKQQSYSTKSYHQQKNSSGHGLRGVKRERGSMLYLQNISVEDETDEDIGRMVRDHCREKGIRVMMHRVIRHRGYQDMASVKLLIPESQEYLALAPDSWPDELSCRRWSKEPPQRSRRWHHNGQDSRGEQLGQSDNDPWYNENRQNSYDERGERRYGHGSVDDWSENRY